MWCVSVMSLLGVALSVCAVGIAHAESPLTPDATSLDQPITLRAPAASAETTQLTYLPPQVSHARLGMSPKDLTALNLEGLKTEVSSAELTYMRQTLPRDPFFESIIYQFSREHLYEIILVGRRDGDAEYVAEFFLKDPPNAPENRWLRDSGEGFDMVFWTYKRNFIIADARHISP